MRFRLKAFGLHLSASATLLIVILGSLYLGWYRWPGWYLTGVVRILVIVGIVDLALGPTLTLLIANPRKPRRELARDIAIIVCVQLVALIYGATTLWRGRPLYYTFSVDRLEIVQASDLEANEIALAQRQNPALAPHWYSRPRWIWAPLPENPDEALKIAQTAVFGGPDVIDMPRYFRAWNQALPSLREKLVSVSDMPSLSRADKEALKKRMTSLGLAPAQRNALLMWGHPRLAVAIFDPDTLRIRAILKAG
jgi:hypothetical protein